MLDEATLPDRARRLYEERQYRELADLLGALPPEDWPRHPHLAFWLADAWRRLGQAAGALDLAHAIAVASRRSGSPRLEHDRLNLEGMLRFETGDVEGAERVWRELLERASQAGQDEFVARANNGLGIVYTLQVRGAEAVTCFERAIAAYRALGLRRGIAQSSQNLAITYRELGHEADADKHFATALRYAREDGSADVIALVELERALLLYLFRRDAALARETVRRSLQRFSSLGDPLGFADALRVLAMIELGEREHVNGRAHAQHALEHARAGHHRLLEAEVLEVLGGILALEGATEEAEGARTVAASIFRELNAPAWGEAFRTRIELLSRPGYARQP